MKKVMSISIEDKLFERFKEFCKAKSVNVSMLLNLAIEDILKREKWGAQKKKGE